MGESFMQHFDLEDRSENGKIKLTWISLTVGRLWRG